MCDKLMSTEISAAVIPEHLADWRPPCDMFSGHAPPCGSGADYGLVTHEGCSIRLTCAPCYRRFLTVFMEWLGERPPTNVVVCHACRAEIDNPWGALRLEPL